jgi:hypothetical protein
MVGSVAVMATSEAKTMNRASAQLVGDRPLRRASGSSWR